MNRQIRGNRLIGLSADRLAGAVGLLLALALVAGGILPVYAQFDDMPAAPHLFEGTASTLSPAEPVPAGTLVQAFVGTELRASATTSTGGHYFFEVSGERGDWITFQVAGVVANDGASVEWISMEVSIPFDLTIPSLPGGVKYNLTMAVSPTGTGTATDVTNASPYAEGIVVSIKAVPAAGYHFVNWTAQAGSLANANAAETSFTMPGQDVTVTANFEEAEEHTLTLMASPIPGGTATDLTDASPYLEGEVVSIQAVAASSYEFVNWSTTAGSFANANAPATTFTMPDQEVTVVATFRISQTDVGNPCFIATAAYGSDTAEEIEILREFRDVVLLPNSLGAEFVSLYYRTSPPIAEFISLHEVLRTAVRLGLNPIIAVLNWSYALWSERG
jgi:uncharacterized repeat protein (TIGR02543 family)